jgi:hypothetical protein
MPKEPEPFGVPTDERIGFDVPESIAPPEHAPQSRHHPASGIGGPSWSHLSLLKQGQLLAEEQIFGCEHTPRPETESEKTTAIEQDERRSNKAVAQGGQEN